jgi:dTDP-4-dehydrorhamnose 3,5-epimerase
MNVIETDLPGVLVIEPKVFGDERGFFMESWNERRYGVVGLPENFVQDNLSFSAHGVLRGLHFQNPNSQGKLVCVLQGEVFDVAVDIRVGSPSFGKWTGTTLSAENRRQLYIPPDFAHGFVVTGEAALFFYKCTDYYASGTTRASASSGPSPSRASPRRTAPRVGSARCPKRPCRATRRAERPPVNESATSQGAKRAVWFVLVGGSVHKRGSSAEVTFLPRATLANKLASLMIALPVSPRRTRRL